MVHMCDAHGREVAHHTTRKMMQAYLVAHTCDAANAYTSCTNVMSLQLVRDCTHVMLHLHDVAHIISAYIRLHLTYDLQMYGYV